jgi:hypothetical protein
MQAYDPNLTLVHTKRIPLGDECCELAVRPTATTPDHSLNRRNEEDAL